MLRFLVLGPTALAITALALTGRGSPLPPASSAHAQAPSLAVNDCIEVNAGDTFDVTISAADVTNLMAWDLYYAYDRRMLEVVGRDVQRFLAEEPNSNVVSLSDPVPNTTGLYHLGAADIGGRGTEESGDGVLAVLTLRARDEGISWSSLYADDANNDGVYDIGPILTQTSGGHVGDSDGDGIFDGNIGTGQIAVGGDCKDPAPTPVVDPGIIPVQAVVSTPAISTPAEGNQPEGTPGKESATPAAAASPSAAVSPSATPHRSPTIEARADGGSGGGSGGLSPLLASVMGAVGGAAIIASYLFLRVIRRPA